jgi:uncharacterized RDD family membrane protein YckC
MDRQLRANVTSKPPPPPTETGFPPPGQAYVPPAGGFVQAPTVAPVSNADHYTPWFTRVLAYIIDSIPVYLLAAIGGVALVAFQEVETICVSDICATGNNGPSTTGWLILAVSILLAVAFEIWNRGARQGKTGSSIGKQIMKVQVVDDVSGQPTGAGKGVARELIYVVFAWLCSFLWLVAVLFPLWDAKRQSLVDKLMKTVCVPL